MIKGPVVLSTSKIAGLLQQGEGFSSVAMNSTYQIRSFVPDDRHSLEDLYRAIYGSDWLQKTRLDWTLDRPMTDAGAIVAVKGSRVVSAQPYCDFPLHTQTGLRRATLFLDVATHPAYQRQGLFSQVVSHGAAAAFARGSSIIMTTPNKVSFLGFQKMPGWSRLCLLDCMVLPLGAGAFAGSNGILLRPIRAGLGILSLLYRGQKAASLSSHADYDVESPWLPGDDADFLWSRLSVLVDNAIPRNGAFLRWRFGPDCRLFLLRDSRGPVGYAAARVITRSGLKVGMVLDCMTTTQDDSSVPLLLSSVVAWLREQGASVAVAFFLEQSVPWKHLRRAGFLRVPSVCAPRQYPVCVSVRPEDPQSRDFLSPSSWHMSLADSDLA